MTASGEGTPAVTGVASSGLLAGTEQQGENEVGADGIGQRPNGRGSGVMQGASTMAVRYQATPNPNAGKFVVDRTIVEGRSSKSFYSAAHAAGDPLASALFAIDGVASIFMVEDFVTVTKTPDADWATLVPRVIDTIEASSG
jgi:hypothetical protein